MRHPFANSKILLTIVQKSLTLILVMIGFTIGNNLYFYNQISQNWRESAYIKANILVDQMESRISNYYNSIYTLQNNTKIQYLSNLKNFNYSYLQVVYITEVSNLLRDITSPISEISNMYVYFNNIDVMIDRVGSSNLETFKKYEGRTSIYTNYSNHTRDPILQQMGVILENSRDYAKTEPFFFSIDQNHYFIFPGNHYCFLIKVNQNLLNQQLEKELPSTDASVKIYNGGNTLFAQNFGTNQENSSKSLSFELQKGYDLFYSFEFNMVPYYTNMVRLTLISTFACLGLVCVIIGIMWSLKKHLYNPLNEMIQKYHLNSSGEKINEYTLVEDSLHKFAAISHELETVRSDIDRELEGYAINQLVYEYSDQSFKELSVQIAPYCVVMVDFEIDQGKKDKQASQKFLSKLQEFFHIVKILSRSYTDIYMVSVSSMEEIRSIVVSALKECQSDISICGISDICPSVQQLKIAYRQAQEAFGKNSYKPCSLLCYADLQKKQNVSSLPLLNEMETRFLNSVLSHNYTEVEQNYEQMIQLYQNTSVERQRKFYLHLYDMLCIILTNEHFNPDEFFNEISSQFTENILLTYHIPYLSKQILICYRKYVLSHAGDKNTLLDMITDFIDRNIDRNISLQELADEMNLSYAYMGRYFRNHMNMGFVEYVQFQKIKLAQYLLLNTELNLDDIAKQTGFTTINSFFRTFKKVTGITPTQFRSKTN